jgi:uncharacterized protein YuzE
VDDDIAAQVDDDGRITSLTFCNASKSMGCDLSALGCVIAKTKNPPYELCCDYYQDEDILDVFFLGERAYRKARDSTDEVTSKYPILVVTNRPGQIIGLQIDRVSSLFCKGFQTVLHK